MSSSPMTDAMYYVLLALCKPNHGYGLMQEIDRLSAGRMAMGPGTLYGLLRRLEQEGLITLLEDDGRRKSYVITETGKEALFHEYRRLKRLLLDGAFLADWLETEESP